VPRKYFIFSTAIFKISNKEGVNNLVTEADHASEKANSFCHKITFSGSPDIG